METSSHKSSFQAITLKPQDVMRLLAPRGFLLGVLKYLKPALKNVPSFNPDAPWFVFISFKKCFHNCHFSRVTLAPSSRPAPLLQHSKNGRPVRFQVLCFKVRKATTRMKTHTGFLNLSTNKKVNYSKTVVDKASAERRGFRSDASASSLSACLLWQIKPNFPVTCHRPAGSLATGEWGQVHRLRSSIALAWTLAYHLLCDRTHITPILWTSPSSEKVE